MTLTIPDTSISFSLGLSRAELVRGFFMGLPPLPAPSGLPRLRELMRMMCDAITAHVLNFQIFANSNIETNHNPIPTLSMSLARVHLSAQVVQI